MLLLAGAVVIGSGVSIVVSSMSAGVFSLTIQEVKASSYRLVDRELRVAGEVVRGSIARGAFETRFAISDPEGRSIDCRYKGTLPDPFAEGRDVILQGRLRSEGWFDVSKITVKCPSKYEEAGMDEEQYQEYYRKKYESGHRRP